LLPYVHVYASQRWYMIQTVTVTDDKIHSHSLYSSVTSLSSFRFLLQSGYNFDRANLI